MTESDEEQRMRLYRQTLYQENAWFKDWGVFVEKECGATHEVMLPENLTDQIEEFLNRLAKDAEEIMEPDTKGLIMW